MARKLKKQFNFKFFILRMRGAEECWGGATHERDHRPVALDGLHRRLRQEKHLVAPGMYTGNHL